MWSNITTPENKLKARKRMKEPTNNIFPILTKAYNIKIETRWTRANINVKIISPVLNGNYIEYWYNSSGI